MKLVQKRHVFPAVALGIVLLAAYSVVPAGVPAAIAAARLRKAAPVFSLRDSKGRLARLSDYRGKVVLLNFWETTCAPCRAEIPWFIEFENTYARRDFAVLGVAMDQDGWQSVKPFMEDRKINYGMVAGNEDVDRAYGNPVALPTTFLIDRSGRVAASHVGLIGKRDYAAEIEAVLAEPVPRL